MDESLAESQHLEDPEDILRVLRSLRLNRSLLTVALPGVREIAASLVLSIDEDAGSWQLDALSESSLQGQLRPGLSVIVRAAYGGIQVSCESRFLGHLSNAAGPLLNFALPVRMLHRQRRAAYRAEIASRDRPTVTLESAQRQTALTGQVFDISAEGLGVVFERFVRPPIEPGEGFSCQQLHPDLPEMSWQLIAKHPQYDKLTDKYRCGFSFTGLSAVAAKKLSQWVLAEQRKQRINVQPDYNP